MFLVCQFFFTSKMYSEIYEKVYIHAPLIIGPLHIAGCCKRDNASDELVDRVFHSERKMKSRPQPAINHGAGRLFPFCITQFMLMVRGVHHFRFNIFRRNAVSSVF